MKKIIFAVILSFLLSWLGQQRSIYASSHNKKYGFIDKTGKKVIAAQFDKALPFSEGLAPVAMGNKWGYIDKTGRIVISPQFDMAARFSEGLAPVLKDGQTSFINKKGRIVIGPLTEGASSFHEGLAVFGPKPSY